jgi:hypothetical protein
VERVLGLVKDGTVYEAWRCPQGHLRIVDTLLRSLPVQLVETNGLRVAHIRCGENCFIFDRRMFRAALRQVLHFARTGSEDLILDLSQVGFIGEPLLTAMRFLESGLRRRGRRMWVVTPSGAVASEIRAAAPGLAGNIVAREGDVFASAAASGMEADGGLFNAAGA